MKTGFVIPVYNHGKTLETVVQQLLPYKLPIILVDDGNDEQNKAQIAAVVSAHPKMILVTREKNGGKGSAMKDGVRKADELGITHIFQIDSDGQHDSGRVQLFLDESEKNPECVICGFPEYDGSVPSRRKNGRKISNAWACFCAGTNEIVDALCGFRIYPVGPYVQLLDKHAVIDNRMGYDADILVHMSWLGVKILSYGVHVTYPADGISNFRMIRDNLHIAGTFSRLCIGRFVRIPSSIVKRIRKGNK